MWVGWLGWDRVGMESGALETTRIPERSQHWKASGVLAGKPQTSTRKGRQMTGSPHRLSSRHHRQPPLASSFSGDDCKTVHVTAITAPPALPRPWWGLCRTPLAVASASAAAATGSSASSWGCAWRDGPTAATVGAACRGPAAATVGGPLAKGATAAGGKGLGLAEARPADAKPSSRSPMFSLHSRLQPAGQG